SYARPRAGGRSGIGRRSARRRPGPDAGSGAPSSAGAVSSGLGHRGRQLVQRLLEVLLGDRREADALEQLLVGDLGPVVGQRDLGGVGPLRLQLVEPLPAERSLGGAAVLALRSRLPADHLVLVEGGDEVV